MIKPRFFLLVSLTTLSFVGSAQGISSIGQFAVGYHKTTSSTAALSVAPVSSRQAISFGWTNGTWGFGTADAIHSATVETSQLTIATAGQSEIIVSPTISSSATVFDLTGKVIYSGKAKRIPVASGLYIVSANGESVKVAVM